MRNLIILKQKSIPDALEGLNLANIKPLSVEQMVMQIHHWEGMVAFFKLVVIAKTLKKEKNILKAIQVKVKSFVQENSAVDRQSSDDCIAMPPSTMKRYQSCDARIGGGGVNPVPASTSAPDGGPASTSAPAGGAGGGFGGFMSMFAPAPAPASAPVPAPASSPL